MLKPHSILQCISRREIHFLSSRTLARRGLCTSATSIADSSDFDHLEKGVSFLNHASFGASPRSVLEKQKEFRDAWQSWPDSWYFGGKLESALREASADVARHLKAPENEVCLVGNATDATVIVAKRWASKTNQESTRNKVMCMNWMYRSNLYILDHYVSDVEIVRPDIVPFPMRGMSSEDARQVILENLERHLVKHRPRFALLEHIHSQPAVLLPLKDMVTLCREHGVEEIAVDGAHGVGSVKDLDIPAIGADVYYTNLHKWGFSPHTATAMWCTEEVMNSTYHPIVSWHYGKGWVSSFDDK